MATFGCLRLVAFTTAFACCGAAQSLAQPALAQPAVARIPVNDDMAMPADMGAPIADLRAGDARAPSADDMAMPDDMGAPLAGAATAADVAAAPHARVLSVNSPIDQIAANPKGKAVLERTLPGLCERAEYPMFKTMSLSRLASLSNGRITSTKLDIVQADLTRLGPVDASGETSHGLFSPFAHTAAYSIHYGGKQIGVFSRALYHRVALVVASM